ncbi:VOC family protein [Streptomyces sp. NBC_01619]|uniref:VOC family protein n=1 Tax=Streptomyces pratisoli TaxID=3139917 RepID=A0ACC6QK61_9ACTN|nr:MULTISPECIES: VOC family protein [unclassified Streptomyces]MCX4512284.1 VOC family protein [Streptomyces sp. NBC_01619]
MTVQPVPEGYTTVTPWIIGHDTAGLIDYLQRAFDAEDLGRFEMEDGTIGHAELRIGNARLMAFDGPKGWPATPAFVRLYVPDAEETHRRAVAAGGTSVTEVTHLYFGDKVGRVRDPYGNVWWIQTHIEDVDEAELERRLSDPEFGESMAYVTGSLARAGAKPDHPAGPPN